MTSTSSFGMRENDPSLSLCWSLAAKISFGKLTVKLDGAARMGYLRSSD